MRNFFKHAGAVLLGMLAMAPGIGRQSANQSQGALVISKESKSTKGTAVAVDSYSRRTIVDEIGGMPFVGYRPDYGMSPRDYGMSLGRSGSAKKSNRLRYSHNAKVKRRNAC